MTEPLLLLLSWLVGCVLGGIFFGGLWWTVRRGVVSQRPVLWFLGSLAVRLAIVLVGFYLTIDGHWERLLVCLAGFLIARVLVIRLIGPVLPPPAGPAEETCDEP